MGTTIFHVAATVGAWLVLTGLSVAQTPTPAQQQAIRSNCVADYRANCSGVPTGGMDALICLEQHEAKLSPGCKSAVEALDHGSTGASASHGTTAATSTESAPAAKSAESETAKASEGAAAATGEAAKTTAPATTTAAAGRSPMSLRHEMRIAARSCARDFRVLCPNLPVGQGNVLFCLKIHANRLSTPCRNALLEAGETF